MTWRYTPLISMMFSSLSPITLLLLLYRKVMYDEYSFLCPARFGDNAAARCQTLAALPRNVDKRLAGADHHAGAVRLRIRRRDRCRTWQCDAHRLLHRLP